MKSSIVSKQGFRRLALASVAAVGVFGASNSFAANTISATSDATVVTPIAVAVATNMNFGNLLAGGAASTVNMSTDGTVSGTANLTSGTKTRASFNVSGTAGATYAITITDNDLTHTDGLTTMALAPIWDFDQVSQDSPTTGTLDVGGAQVIYLGGGLSLGASQLAGDYSGTVTATVDYN